MLPGTRRHIGQEGGHKAGMDFAAPKLLPRSGDGIPFVLKMVL